MCCKKKGHKGFWCGMILALLLIGGAILFMTKTKNGRKISKKARRIAGEVEELVKDELHMG